MRYVILLALLGTAVAFPKSINRIVGGTPTTVQNYPYISNMQHGMWGIWWYHECGGSLITSRAVLSAAQCYFGDSPFAWRVRLGTSLASSGGFLHEVSHLVIHPQYSFSTLENDVAIVRLTIPAVYSTTVQSVGIASANYYLPDNANVVTVGWGALSSGGLYSEELQHVTINIINQEICAQRYAYLKTQPGYQNWPDITDRMLCAGILDVGGKDSCRRDTGGPLVHNGAVVGIVSWGFQCAHPEYPGVNVRVSRFTDWIVNNA